MTDAVPLLRDPLFLACVAIYYVNRWLVKPLVAGGFFHDHLNDLICIPFFVPIMLFVLRKLGLRRSDGRPSATEILIPVSLWSLLFEVVLPGQATIGRGMTADYRDIFYYAFGGLLASSFWLVWYGRGIGRGATVESTLSGASRSSRLPSPVGGTYYDRRSTATLTPCSSMRHENHVARRSLHRDGFRPRNRSNEVKS